MDQQNSNQQNVDQQNLEQQKTEQHGYNQQNTFQQGMGQPGMYRQNMNSEGMGQQVLHRKNLNPLSRGNDDLNPQESWLYEEEQDPDKAKKILSWTGFGLFITAAAVLLIQSLIGNLVDLRYPAIAETDWYIWAVTALSVVGVGLPAFYLMTKQIPNSRRGERQKLKLTQFLALFFICTAAMYITNFFSVIITVLISLAKGENIFDLNPLLEIIEGSNFVLTLIYAAIIAPIVEELLFRKLLLDKLRRFGDIPAILISGIAFGLFHMNLSQMFYATVLGMIFAYVTIRTNTVKYSIFLHIMINFIGTAITPLATQQNMVFSLIMVIWVFSAITLGIVLFVLNLRKIRLYRAQHPLEKKSVYFWNTGTVLYTLLCLIIIVMVTIS